MICFNRPITCPLKLFWSKAICIADLADKSGVLGHAVEYGVLVGEQLVRRRVLYELALVQHHDLGGVHDGVETMGDGEHRARRELGPDCFL